MLIQNIEFRHYDDNVEYNEELCELSMSVVGLSKCVPILRVIFVPSPRAKIVVLMHLVVGVGLNRRPATRNINGHEPGNDYPGRQQPYKIA
jgi:hypothetical protein